MVAALPRSSLGECSRTILGGEPVVLPQNSTFDGCPPPILAHITAGYEMTVSVRRHADAGVPKVSSPLLP